MMDIAVCGAFTDEQAQVSTDLCCKVACTISAAGGYATYELREL
jgi:hypothetical protein